VCLKSSSNSAIWGLIEVWISLSHLATSAYFFSMISYTSASPKLDLSLLSPALALSNSELACVKSSISPTLSSSRFWRFSIDMLFKSFWECFLSPSSVFLNVFFCYSFAWAWFNCELNVARPEKIYGCLSSYSGWSFISD